MNPTPSYSLLITLGYGKRDALYKIYNVSDRCHIVRI
jgi:hypothetical protein